MKVSVSVLSNEIKPQDIVKKLDLSKPDYIHIDIMDGKFVSNKTWTTSEVKKFTSYSTLPLEVHLMVNNPSKYIEDYALMNTSIIIFHYEAVKDINEMINKVKLYGLKVGIAINPETNINVLIPYLNMIDEVLIMSVHPGKSGQSFIEESLEKISVLKNIILEGNYKTIISVDGGINNETGLLCKDAGADELVSASYIHKDIINNIKTLKNI
ncbi:MAG: ribulose-phosphate 3-epimerase [Clostridium sp.]|nr:ribulose-phosphate 3-epimerase [Clostridium sp.]